MSHYLEICLILKDYMDERFNCYLYFHSLHYFKLPFDELFYRVRRVAKVFVLFQCEQNKNNDQQRLN